MAFLVVVEAKLPHTVRRRVWAIRPTTRAVNVRNVGVVKQDRNTVSEAGTVSSGSIDGSLSRRWCRHHRCLPHETPRSTRRAGRHVTDPHNAKVRNTRVAFRPWTTRTG